MKIVYEKCRELNVKKQEKMNIKAALTLVYVLWIFMFIFFFV